MSIKNKHKEKNETLINGMALGHLMEDAEIWYNDFASERLRSRNFSNESATQQDALNATNPIHPNYIGGKSGILLGYKWPMLTPPERERVLRAYVLTLSGSTIQMGG
jgi:hypothetical protein